jgi:DNA-binding NarL/FixJ family response regulator
VQALIVDDHTLIRDALRGVLNAFEEIEGVVEAVSSSDAGRLLEQTPAIGLVLLDLNLPDSNGLEFLRSIRAEKPSVAVVVLSASEDRNDMTKALTGGAAGFIPKSASRDVMQGALKLILSGGIYVPPEILIQSVRRPAPGQKESALRVGTKLGLTERQVEVLQLMMQGMSNKAICRALDIAEPTVKNHVTAILRALGATNRTEAVIAAASLGVAPPETGD